MKTILVVDDDVHLAKLMSICLNKAGYNVFTSHQGQAAIEWVNARAPEIDLIVLDVVMPGIDGYETMSRIRKNPYARHVPILLCTGQDQGGAIQELQFEKVEYIHKPFTMEQLLHQVHAILERSQERARG